MNLKTQVEAIVKTKESVEQGERYNEKNWGHPVHTWQYVSKKGKEISMIGVGVFRADMSIATAKEWLDNKDKVAEAIASELPKTDAEKLADALAKIEELTANK